MTREEPGFVHDALYYGSDEQLLETAVPFLRAGIDAGETVLVVSTDHNATLLNEALDRDSRIVFLPREETYRRAPRTISTYQRFVEREIASGKRGVRLVGEVAFGASATSWKEWARYESILNHALAAYPIWITCAYDTRALHDDILRDAEATHPFLARNGSRVESSRYLDPADFLLSSSDAGPDPLEATEPMLEIADPTDLGRLRQEVRGELESSALATDAVDDLVVAVTEIVTNALTHGRPPVRVRLWTSATRLLFTVTDHGAGFDDPFAGYMAPTAGDNLTDGGMGLWAARQLCDRMDLYRTPEGFTVRVVLEESSAA
jgi:anti-sigma regulatory factor (Ser/Thr protein kinase)